MASSPACVCVQLCVQFCDAVGVGAAAEIFAYRGSNLASGYATKTQEHNVLDLVIGGTSGRGSFRRRSARASSLPPEGSRPRRASLGNDDANDSPNAWANPQDEQHAEAEAFYERHSWACNKNAQGEGFTDLGHVTEQSIRGKTGAVGKGLPCGEEEDDWGGYSPPGGTSPRAAVVVAAQGCTGTIDGGSKASPCSPYRRLFSAGFFRKKPAVGQQATCAMMSELQNANGCAPPLLPLAVRKKGAMQRTL